MSAPLPFLDRVVEQLNSSIKKHPAETLAVLFASDIGSIGAMYSVLTLTGACLQYACLTTCVLAF